MGDRNNPMKFGPEWLRNLSRERSGGGNGSNNSQQPTNSNPTGYGSGSVMGQNTRSLSGPNPGVMSGTNSGNMVTPGFLGAVGPQALASSTGAAAMGGDLAVPGPSTGAIPRNRIYMNKVQLAKLRYGREEMLALYDRTVESPEELKYFDLLYQPRGKAPFALLNSFEEDTRGNGRGAGTLAGHVSNTERYTSSRGGIGRGMALTEAHGRSRMPFVRQPSLGRGNAWHVNNTRHTLATTQWPQHSSVEDESTLRSWNNNNNVANPGNRTTTETPEWNPNKTFRRRPNNNTNWRQPQSREEGDEWRSNENNKNRPPSDKWDREWGERPNQDRQQSWNSNRKTWVGNENDDNLPEWAVDSVEAGAGTFDSSGAFHGYSNDDSNIPKSQETCLPLARSQTHGSFSHLKSAEEGSDEWWTSEKRKKLSAKKFDAATGKYSQVDSFGSAETLNLNSKNNVKIKDNNDPPETQDNANDSNGEESNQNMFTNQFQESKTFDALMRSEITLEESNDERSNFQSVMIPPNNGLRQKHQNLVPGAMDSTGRHSGLLQMIRALSRNQSPSDEFRKSPDEMIVEKILDMSLDESKMQNQIIAPMLSTNCMNPGMPNQMANPNLQIPMGNQGHPNHSLVMNSAPNMQMGHFLPPMQPMPNVGLPNQINPTMQNVGMHNVAMNSALPLGPVNNGGLVMAMRGVPPPVMPNPGMQTRLGFQPNTGMPMMPRGNASGSLFMDPSNPQITNQQQSNAQNNMFPMQHQMKHSAQAQASQSHFNSMYNVPPPITPDSNLVDAWYYEDPEKMIQGPFSSKEMYNWYRAGFFSPSLMVRRACETHLRPLGSYGPVVPFIQLDSLWSPPVPSADMIWMQQMNSRNESRINNLPMFFWDAQGNSAISSNSALPEGIVSEMKTEDQILAQLRASQNLPIQPNVTYIKEHPPTSSAVASVAPSKPDESFPTTVSATPNLDVLNKLIDTEKFGGTYNYRLPNSEIDKNEESEVKDDKPTEVEMPPPEPVPVPSPVPAAAPAPVSKPQETLALAADSKTSKQTNNETDKTAKKDVATKGKNKKAKEEKKEEISETKTKKEEIPTKTEQKQTQKRSVESSPTKNKKEDKPNKKEQDKEKKELIKDGFTIVKGVDKTSHKESKKKVEEAKLLAAAAEESERKRKDEEKIALEEEKKRKIDDAIKKAQEQQQQRQECVPKKAPWSSVSTQVVATTPDGLTLAEIQRLEREKKVEQMREQQHMIHLIAQQQAAALAREQEMQAGLGWAKKSSSNLNTSKQSLAEIQTETRKAAAAAAASVPVTSLVEEPSAPAIPWTSTHNGGFWETQASVPVKAEKTAETLKLSESGKSKKKLTLNTSKKETTPKVEFESWCTTILTSWSSKIDVPTFIGFLKDIESPYEVKDYVKCYLGDSKDSSDFARQFLERRSKLLRVGMVTPSDDLCSPAMAINPRNTNLGEYQEVKGKGKKTKKNKMLKVDARILGFSVTASEDRINVGDIDTV